MISLSPKLAAKLPVRIDISWVKRRENEMEPSAPSAAESPEQATLLTQILELNPTASLDFLTQFSPIALRDYLDHLSSASMPRGRLARRLRPDNMPGVTVRTTRM